MTLTVPGVRVVNEDIEASTSTALADALEGNGESDGKLYDAAVTNKLDRYDVGNLYAAGIAGSFNPVSFNYVVWYINSI